MYIKYNIYIYIYIYIYMTHANQLKRIEIRRIVWRIIKAHHNICPREGRCVCVSQGGGWFGV